MSTTNTRRRVKVYQLDETGQWEDKGTGHVDCLYFEKMEGMSLLVKSEKDPETLLLETKLYLDEIYQRQADTLIVWNDPATDADLALSFQEAAGCQDIWDLICSIQRSEKRKDDSGELSMSSTSSVLELPEPLLSTIERIEQIVSRVNTTQRRDQITQALAKDNYAFLRKLIEVFETCEDLEDKASLHIIYNIVKGLILLNDAGLFETFFSDEFVYSVLGALEYDPEISKPQRHRQFLRKQVVFKEVIPFRNPEIVAKIHQTFRLQYFKDVVLPRALDDGTFATINSLIFFNQVEIVGAIQNDEKFLSDLFSKLKQNPSQKEIKECVNFIQELCALAKNLQIQSRMIFYQTLYKYGVCEVIQMALPNSDLTVRLSAINILDAFLAHDLSLIRSFILSQRSPALGPVTRTIVISNNNSNANANIRETSLLHRSQEISNSDSTISDSTTTSTTTDDNNNINNNIVEKDKESSNNNTNGAIVSNNNNGISNNNSSSSSSSSSSSAHMTISGNKSTAVAPTAAEKYPFFARLIDAFLFDRELGVIVQLTEILRALLDVSNMEDSPEKDEFLTVFYSDFIQRLIEPFGDRVEHDVDDSVKESICDILGFCVQHHGYRIKYFILGNNIVAKVLKLLKRRERHLVLAAIRFFRAFVGMRDEFYNRHITKFNLFEPIMEVFQDNGDRYNLLNSAIIELFEYIRKENVKHLISHLAEHHRANLESISYVDTCKALLLKYDQSIEPSPVTHSQDSASTVSPGSLANSREGDNDEDYFKDSDDENESIPPKKFTVQVSQKSAPGSATAATTSTNNAEAICKDKTSEEEPPREFKPMLVDYEDDEEDDLLAAAKSHSSTNKTSPTQSPKSPKNKISFNIKKTLDSQPETEENNNNTNTASNLENNTENSSTTTETNSQQTTTNEELSTKQQDMEEGDKNNLKSTNHERSEEALDASPKRQKTE